MQVPNLFRWWHLCGVVRSLRRAKFKTWRPASVDPRAVVVRDFEIGLTKKITVNQSSHMVGSYLGLGRREKLRIPCLQMRTIYDWTTDRPVQNVACVFSPDHPAEKQAENKKSKSKTQRGKVCSIDARTTLYSIRFKQKSSCLDITRTNIPSCDWWHCILLNRTRKQNNWRLPRIQVTAVS